MSKFLTEAAGAALSICTIIASLASSLDSPLFPPRNTRPGSIDWMLEVSPRYRPAAVRYEAANKAYVEHRVGAALWFVPSRHLDVAVDAEQSLDSDIDVLVVQGVVAWRLGF